MSGPICRIGWYTTSDSFVTEIWGEECGPYRCGTNAYCDAATLIFKDEWRAEFRFECFQHFTGIPDTKIGCSCENSCCEDPTKCINNDK